MTVNIFIPDNRNCKAIIRSSLTFPGKRLKLDEKNNHILQIRNGGFLKCLESVSYTHLTLPTNSLV